MDIFFWKYASCQKLAVKINTTLSWVSAGIKQRESSVAFFIYSLSVWTVPGALTAFIKKIMASFGVFDDRWVRLIILLQILLKSLFLTPPTTTVPAQNFKNGQKNVDTRQLDLLSMYSSVFVGKWCDPILSSICCLTTQYYRPLIFRRRRTTITGVHIHQCGTCFSHLFIHLHICLLTYQKQS